MQRVIFLLPPHCNLRKWLNTFSEVNNIVAQKENGTRRLAVLLSQRGLFHIAYLLINASWIVAKVGGKLKQIF